MPGIAVFRNILTLPIQFRRTSIFYFLLWVFLLPSLVSAQNTYDESINTGVAWLKSQQRTDGGFSGAHSQATEYQATIEALLALHQLSKLDAATAQSGSDYLRLHHQVSGHLEEIANLQRLKKANPTYFSASTNQLNAYRSTSGGYGDYPGYEGAISTSAILVHALSSQDSQLSVNLSEVIAYMLSKQKADKGWAEESNRSSVYVTALVSRALQAHRFTFNLSTSISSSSEFLLTNQKAGGGWPGNLETAIALLAVVPAVADSSRYKNALDQLAAAQLLNGSWNNDVYTTALALQVLQLIKNPPVIDVPTTGSISGALVSASSNLSLTSAQIVLDGPSSQILVTDGGGHFSANSLKPGNYELTYKAQGFQQASQTLQLDVGDRIDLGIIKLNALPTSALISGKVTDSTTGSPLAGVVIAFAGSQNSQVITDHAGSYSLELAPGTVSISVSHNGYYPVNGNINAVAGTHFDFSPALQTLDNPPNTEIKLRGMVVDGQSNEPLFGANIYIASTVISGLSGTDGSFTLSGLPEGTIHIEVTLNGYQPVSFTGTALANSVIDLGTVRLMPVVPESSTLYGRVLDAETGAPIPNATIAVGSQSTVSNVDGTYELKDIDSEMFGLSATAEGYQSANGQVSITGYGKLQIDIPLTKILISDISFEQVTLERSIYNAYEEVKLNGTIRNQGETTEEIIIQAQVVNPLGIIIEEFSVSDDISSGAQPLELAPNAEEGFDASWFTQSYAPGQYTVVVAAYANSTSQLLAQKHMSVEIRPTTKLASLKLMASLDHVNQGSTHEIGFSAALRNQSNVSLSARINYDLSDPAGNVLFVDDAMIEIAPTQIFGTFELGSHSQLFSASGAYTLRILGIDSVQPTLIEAGAINTIPNIHINIEQAITPAVVVPSTSERVRVKIRLEGTEVK